MTMKTVKILASALLLNIVIALPCVVAPNISSFVYAQDSGKVRTLPADFIPEEGCPVAVTNIRTELDLDPFDAPVDARIYVTYKNIGQTPISAAKFRLRFVDNTGKDLGTFQGADGAMLQPGMETSQKWKRDRLEAGAIALKVRVLMVKMMDGNLWQSAKLQSSNGAAAGDTTP